MSPCSVCGNDTSANDGPCPFCGAPQQLNTERPARGVAHRTVNIERGRPLVATALKMMDNELARARADNVRVLTLIHGYRSSGKGGKIRTECRKVLDHLVRNNGVKQIIQGGLFRKRTGPGKALLQRFPELERDCASDFSNPGVTIVVL